ncbi:MAG TPA: hypothetical protein VK524_03805, partial [Polyangiaceae bacterium]|nr:hypothetical protein [Polyangiaceae bacterium]
ESSSTAAEAFGLAALFALHGGWRDLSEAFQVQATGPGVEPAPPVAAWLAIVAAARAIDDEAARLPAESNGRAIDLAARALERTQALDLRDRAPVLGQALGTLGRAFLHAGEPERGLPHLRESVAHHKQHEPKEGPRSLTYLATCLRHAGAVAEASSTIEEALRGLEAMPRHILGRTTRQYAMLERGRCALARGDSDIALYDLQQVVDDEKVDAQHPRVSALRGLAAAHRGLANTAAAAMFMNRCVKVAEGAHDPLYRLLGIMAVGDALVAGEACDAHLRDLWAEFTHTRTASEAKELLDRWVY